MVTVSWLNFIKNLKGKIIINTTGIHTYSRKRQTLQLHWILCSKVCTET
jgi:hypothetical protein